MTHINELIKVASERYQAGVIIGENLLSTNVLGPGAPATPQTFGPSQLVLTNTSKVSMMPIVSVDFFSNCNLQGSCTVDMIVEIQANGTGYQQAVQSLKGLSGTIALDPNHGGDGTTLPQGLNGLHINSSESVVAFGGGTLLDLPASVAPNTSLTLDIRGNFQFSGSWNSSIVLLTALTTAILLPLPAT